MTRHLFIILKLLTVSTFAQSTTIKVKKISPDTINYNIFPDGYSLRYECKEIKTSRTRGKYFELNSLYFIIIDQENELTMYNNIGHKTPVTLNDTIINWSWDNDNKGLGGNHGMFFGKAKLNKKTNTLTIEQEISDDKKKLRKLRTQYKVLKWTFYEIIFKDITHLSNDLTYIFRH